MKIMSSSSKQDLPKHKYLQRYSQTDILLFQVTCSSSLPRDQAMMCETSRANTFLSINSLYNLVLNSSIITPWLQNVLMIIFFLASAPRYCSSTANIKYVLVHCWSYCYEPNLYLIIHHTVLVLCCTLWNVQAVH